MLKYIGGLGILFFVTIVHGKTCDTKILFNSKQCSPTETCTPTTSIDGNLGTCECLPGLTRANDSLCTNFTAEANSNATPRSSSLVTNDKENGNSHVIAEVLLPIFLIMVVIVGVYFSRKYGLTGYIRRKIAQRSSNYDEVMIGRDLDDDDDPPLR